MLIARWRISVCCAATLCLLDAACEEPQHSTAGVEGVTGFGEPDAAHAPGKGEDAEPLAYAAVTSDRTVTTIALLQPSGKRLRADFIDSGSASAGLVTALSGDVVVPTRSGDPETLTLIDRFRTDVVTRIDVASGDILAQIQTQTPNAQGAKTAFSSNPQDYVRIDDHHAWVTRFNANPSADAAVDRGDDMLELDPSKGTRTGRRIDFSPLDVMAERQNPDTGKKQSVVAYARPSKIVRLGHFAVVGLARLSESFDAIGPGMVALVDLDARSVHGVALDGLQNCGQVVPVPDDATRVAVACAGFLHDDPRPGSGLALLRLQNGTLSIEHVWRASEHAQAAMTAFGLVAIGGNVVAAVAAGQDPTTQSMNPSSGAAPPDFDQLYRVDLASGEQQLLLQAEGRFVLGDGSYNPRRGILLVPDASVDAHQRPTAGVHRFSVDAHANLDKLDVVPINATLPVWQVMPL
jgi:hypothetical protein